MVKKEQSKRQKSIKSKLLAAVCMLLVSCIMMVSSTYAWFTLSTAPEVTGITTSVGANGNLEMALMPKDGITVGAAAAFGITSSSGDATKDMEERNITWGNLVNLSDSTIYGLKDIVLFPSALNNTGTTLAGTFLKTPTYGADGRVGELSANTVTSYYSATNGFIPNDSYGVRAVGVASGMTDRQLDYRNGRTNGNTARAQAQTIASQSLNANGSALANVAIKKGTKGENAVYNKADVDAFKQIVNDLLGYDKSGSHVTGALEYIETAYIQYILAYAASNATNTTSGDTVTVNDATWTAVRSAVNAENATLASVIAAIGGNDNLPESLKTAIAAYEKTLADVKDAQSKLNSLDATDESYTWTELSPILTLLANPDRMLVNGIKAGEIMQGDNMNKLVNSVTGGAGIVVSMATGGGVYADIADQCGDYTASVEIEKVEYNGLSVGPLTARMATESTVTTAYLNAIAAAVNAAGAPVTGDNADMPISDMYGFIIDLAFRTNAAESNLLLQADAIDRIYDETNTASGGAELNGESTMGHGASMTFKATTPDFSNEQIKALMDAIRLVFFDPSKSDTNIIIYGKLDTANATIGADGVTAKIVLCEMSEGGDDYVLVTSGTAEAGVSYFTQIVTQDSYNAVAAPSVDAIGTYYERSGDAEPYTYTLTKDTEINGDKTYYTKTEGTVTWDPFETEAGVTDVSGKYKKVTNAAGTLVPTGDNVIMPLTQNIAHALSVLVYLDGNYVGNDDVAATAATSMTGSMNLQFSSSANLVPMEYTDLMVQGQTPANPPAQGGGENAEGGEG